MHDRNRPLNSPSLTLQCYRAIRSERRANDLTVEALLREVLASLATTFAKAIDATAGAYTSYNARQERRRRHYRRAMRAVSQTRTARDVRAAGSLVAVSVPELVTAPTLVHFAPQTGKQRQHNAVVTTAFDDEAPLAPEAHVCDRATRKPSHAVTAS